jgi:hypothetical protein
MIQVPLDAAVLARAQEIVQQENILPAGAVDRSISGKGAGAVWEGAVGQAVFERAMADLGIPCIHDGRITHDYKAPVGTVEVKTKERSYAPKGYFEASLYNYNESWQSASWYAFVSLLLADGQTKTSAPSEGKYSAAWVMGCIKHERFIEIAKEVKKGDQLQNGQLAGFSSRNIQYSELEAIKSLGGTND